MTLPTDTGGTGQEEKPFVQRLPKPSGPFTPDMEMDTSTRAGLEKPYEFVTKEEIGSRAYYGAGGGWKSVPESVALKVLAERDAFRAVAVQVSYEYGLKSGTIASHKDFYPAVDGEAKRLLSEKNGGKS